ncbi:MAG: hypothetical protein LBH76_09040 [Propionibacteriaceae bacterium]|nr:hypothetical protein [Propionibacteriaceae bacterium]
MEWPAHLVDANVAPNLSRQLSPGMPWLTVVLGPEAGHSREPNQQDQETWPSTVSQVRSQAGANLIPKAAEALKGWGFPGGGSGVLAPAPVLEDVVAFWTAVAKDRLPYFMITEQVPYAFDKMLVAVALLSKAAAGTGVPPRHEDSALALGWELVVPGRGLSHTRHRKEVVEWVREAISESFPKPDEDQLLEKTIRVFRLRELVDWCWANQLKDSPHAPLLTWADWQLLLSREHGWVAHGALPRVRFPSGSETVVKDALVSVDPFRAGPGLLHRASASAAAALAGYCPKWADTKKTRDDARADMTAEDDVEAPPLGQEPAADPDADQWPPIASVFTTSFDLHLEKALSELGPYIAAMPFYVTLDEAALGVWLGRFCDSGEALGEATSDDRRKWFVLSLLTQADFRGDGPSIPEASYIGKRLSRALGAYPIAVHLLGCPLIEGPRVDEDPELKAHLLAVARLTRAELEEDLSPAVPLGITPAVQLTDSDVVRWAMTDTARNWNPGSAQTQVTRFSTALPLPLTAGTRTGEFFRYWVFGGVPLGDSATRFCVLSQILGADFVNGDATPAERGVAVGAFRIGHRAAETLSAEKIRLVYGRWPDSLAQHLDHYTYHVGQLTAGRESAWRRDTVGCAKEPWQTRSSKKGSA